MIVGVLVAGLTCVVLATAVGRWREGLRFGLELWLAAGLLRLSADAEWPVVAVSATVVVLRRVVGRTLLSPP